MTAATVRKAANAARGLEHASRRFILAAVLLALSSFCLFSQTMVSIEGTIRNSAGDVINSDVTVQLETLEGDPMGQSPVNSDGHFNFPDLNKIAYVLIVTAKGYEPYHAQINSEYTAGDYVHDVTLTPQYQIKRNGQAAPSLTDLRAPKQARKEYEKGEKALASKNLKAAQAHFGNAVGQFPCYARAQTGLATVLILKHDGPRAEEALRKALKCDPDFLDSYIELGQLLNDQKEYSESISVLQEGIRRSPASWQFYLQLGVAQSGLMQNQAAETSFEKVLSFNPHPPSIYYVKLADLYVEEKDFDKAYQQMKKYLAADPRGQFVERIKQIMQQMRSAGVLHSAPAHAN